MLICLLCLSQDDTAGYSSGDNNCEEINGSARQLRSSSLTRDRPSYASSEKFTSPMTVSPPNCFCSSTFYLITWVWRDIYSNFFFDLPKQYISQPQQNFSIHFSKYTFVASLLKQLGANISFHTHINQCTHIHILSLSHMYILDTHTCMYFVSMKYR